MSIKFSCPKCDQPLVIPDELAGKRRKCPKCGVKFTVPTVNVVLGSDGGCNSEIFAIARPMAWIALGNPNSWNECPPGPLKVNS